MKLFAAFLIFASSLYPQVSLTATRALPNVRLYAGSTMAVQMQLMVTAGSMPMAIQFDLNGLPVTAITITEGPLDTGVGKTMQCAPTAAGVRCISFGMNTKPYIGAGGILATLNLTLGQATPGAASLAIVAPLSAAADATAIAVVPSSALPITIYPPLPSPCDLNSDGVVDTADVVLSLNQALGSAACSNADLNADGNCDLADLAKVIMAQTGQACSVPLPPG